MKTITFDSDYRHPLSDMREAHYQSGETYEVSEAVAEAAQKAGKVKNGSRSEKRVAPGRTDGTEG